MSPINGKGISPMLGKDTLTVFERQRIGYHFDGEFADVYPWFSSSDHQTLEAGFGSFE